ncbi:nucleotide sugar dehydrogenase [Streptococcus pseudopneumoniae]|uniref:UDP-glucose 6-dehydrogenase n=1 Tax=Streptococcus pseudopneumoniae TaxID=257758 RepID=A0A3A4N7E3_9STRE|nr:nucleotide sugar dehydrogenase [Streptococcus pseudopneumoniae]RJP12310.1 UDP-glucose 6-dehydrogenase [Streptococcus pseudopneumoniae]TMR85785.1 nucleotide sugar dehydrogenase [Streptococcus pseudopneumoniae]
MNKNITVFGLGYVGLSSSLVLGQYNFVRCYDISTEKINDFRRGRFPNFVSRFIEEEVLSLHNLNFYCDINDMDIEKSDYVILAISTNFDDSINALNTEALEKIIRIIYNKNKLCTIIIRSTVPIGFTESIINTFKDIKICIMPEFLRENSAVFDSLYPSRIIVGTNSEVIFSSVKRLFCECINIPEEKVLMTSPTEAEAIKLFSNTYLAMRVAFFNELDMFAEVNKINTQNVILGIGLDPRIGMEYNNPSFGYGGYCLPKDTLQLENQVNSKSYVISAISKSNIERKNHIVDMVLKRNANRVGIYRLVMKQGSDNYRNSAIIDIIEILKAHNIEMIVFEPVLREKTIMDIPVEKDFTTFSENVDIILANRIDEVLANLGHKVYTRDVYGVD